MFHHLELIVKDVPEKSAIYNKSFGLMNSNPVHLSARKIDGLRIVKGIYLIFY